VQADVAPAGAADPEHRSQLVAETERAEDVAVAGACLHVASGRLEERAHARSLPRERRPLVHVVAEELVPDEVGNRFGGDLLLVRLGEEKCRRIDCRPEGRIEGHGPAQSRQHLIPERLRRKTGPADLDDRAGQVLEHWAPLHRVTPSP
jgi:hypothetical protein